MVCFPFVGLTDSQELHSFATSDYVLLSESGERAHQARAFALLRGWALQVTEDQHECINLGSEIGCGGIILSFTSSVMIPAFAPGPSFHLQ